MAILAVLTLLSSCQGAGGEDVGTAGVEIRIGALELPGVEDVCYSVTVVSAANELVLGRGLASTITDPDRNPAYPSWSGTTPYTESAPFANGSPLICSTRFGNGPGGDWSYVAPCDASVGTHTVTVWLDAIHAEGGALLEASSDYQDPCPTGCSLEALCVENADTPVTFNLTVMRRAEQGFFDLAVSFEAVYCSAKVDCVYGPEAPILSLHHPETGARGQTAVVALACVGGPGGEPLTLLRDPLTVTCDGLSWELDPGPGDGNVYTSEAGANPAPAGSPVWQYAIYSGYEDLPCGTGTCPSAFWNVAIGFDPEVSACTLTTRATGGPASTLAALSTPEASTWPIIAYDIPLTFPDDEGLACSTHPLNGEPAGVSTTYTTVDTPQIFTIGFGVDGFHPSLPSGLPSGDLVLHLDAGSSASYPGNGSTWFDLSGADNDGTLNGAVTHEPDFGGVMHFNFGSDQVAVPHDPAFGPPVKDAFTVGLWFQSSAHQCGRGVITQNTSGTNYDWMVYYTGCNGPPYSMSLYIRSATGVVEAFSAGNPLQIGSWYSYVFVLANQQLLTYINGQLASTHTYVHPTIRQNGGPLSIGRGWDGSFAGLIPIVSIWQRSLTAAEVAAYFETYRGRFGL